MVTVKYHPLEYQALIERDMQVRKGYAGICNVQMHISIYIYIYIPWHLAILTVVSWYNFILFYIFRILYIILETIPFSVRSGWQLLLLFILFIITNSDFVRFRRKLTYLRLCNLYNSSNPHNPLLSKYLTTNVPII